MDLISKFISWNASGQKKNPEVRLTPTIGFDYLPPEVTEKIWENLSSADHKILRQVCKRFKGEVDTNIGVHGRLDGTRMNQAWISSVKLLSLNVENYQKVRIPLADFWWNTNSVQRLVIVQGGLSYSNAKCLFSLFTGLKELTLAPRKLLEAHSCGILSQNHNLLTSNDLPAILSAVKQNKRLEVLNVSLNRVNPSTRRYRNNHRVDWDAVEWIRFEAPIRELSISAPDLDVDGRRVWLRFLESQFSLEKLVSDIGLINPSDLQPIILRTASSLKKIALHNMACSENNTSCIFNWAVFSECDNLTSLTITADRNGDENSFYLFSTNMYKFRFERLEELELDHVRLTTKVFSRLLICAVRSMKVLKLHFYKIELTNTLYDELDWAIHYGCFQYLSLAERTQRFQNEENFFEDIVATCCIDTKYWHECSSPAPGYTLVEYTKWEEGEGPAVVVK